uniref:Uncharacterized protein n=1 Tax=Anguilla anguilla TaxID=7936 RepID=A0A0E9W0N7_ANGAN
MLCCAWSLSVPHTLDDGTGNEGSVPAPHDSSEACGCDN